MNDSRATIVSVSGLSHLPPVMVNGWCLITLAILVAGTVLNSFNFLVLVLYWKNWSCGHILLITLAGLDGTLSGIFHSATLYTMMYGLVGLFSNYLFCTAFEFLHTYMIFCSTLGCLRIAVYRVFQTENRKTEGASQRLRVFIKTVLLTSSYTFAAILTVLPLYRNAEKGEAFPSFRHCRPDPIVEPPYIRWITTAFWIFTPSLFMVTCYIRVYTVLKKRQNHLPGIRIRIGCMGRETSAQLLTLSQRRAVQRLTSLLRRMIWTLITYFVTQYPVPVLRLVVQDFQTEPMANLVTFSCLCLSGTLNAIVYGIMDPQMTKPYRNFGHLLLRVCRHYVP